MAGGGPRLRRGHRGLKWAAGGLLLTLLALGVAISVALRQIEPLLRARIVTELQWCFHARVELDSFHVSLLDGLSAEGKGLRIWPPAQVVGDSVPGAGENGVAGLPQPLIRLAEFRFHAPLRYVPGKPIHISVVELKGLDVDVPPKPYITHAATAGGSKGVSGLLKSSKLRFEVDGSKCSNAHLTLETSKPGKLPLEFAIARLKLTGVDTGGPMQFVAELTTRGPKGSFSLRATWDPGPWMIRARRRSRAVTASSTPPRVSSEGLRGSWIQVVTTMARCATW